MAEQRIYTADRIFTGETWLTDHAIVVEDKMIKKVVPISSLPSAAKIGQFNKCVIAPAFIDLQLYGANGKLLAVYPEPATLSKMSAYAEKGGAAFCLPTVATNSYEVFYNCIDAIKEYWNSGAEGILGLHIEGPWINAARKGAHIESLIHSPEIKQVNELLNYGKGVIKMITLAPEVCHEKVLATILSHNIIIAAGHSNATYNEAKISFAMGITTVTHLFNAMSPLQHRAPGLVGAVMDDNKTMASIIPDGYHVDFSAIRIAKKILKERLFVVTDAVTDTTVGHYQHLLAGDKYEAAGILSGSALTMDKAAKNLVNYASIETEEALRMCSLYPARVMKLDHKLGKILPGYSANLVVLNNELETILVLRH